MCAAVFWFGPWASQAGHSDVQDGNDARGPLDVRLVQMTSGNEPRWTVWTWEPWRAVSLWDRGFIVVKYDTFGDSHFDYYALVRSVGSRLRGTLHRDYRRKTDEQLRRLTIKRPERRGVRVKVPYRSMRFATPFEFRWMVTTSWSAARCRGAICLDRAPDRGAVEEPRRPVPTPTLTLTPTPVPSDTDR